MPLASFAEEGIKTQISHNTEIKTNVNERWMLLCIGKIKLAPETIVSFKGKANQSHKNKH